MARDIRSSELWTSVASSANGLKLVAVSADQQINTSKDGGDDWATDTRAKQKSWLMERGWNSVASSGDGRHPGGGIRTE